MTLIIGVVLAALTEAMAGTVLSLGRGDIMGDSYATPDEFAWLDISYVALKMVGFIIAPWLIARFTPRSILLFTTAIMGTACVLAAFTTDTGGMVALRIAQGLAGGVLLVAAQTLLFLAFPRTRQPIVQAIFAMAAVVAPATIAPALQGWFLDSQSWTWIFFANAPLAAVAVGLLLMTDADPVAPPMAARFDWAGMALLATSLGCIAYLCIQGNRWNWFEAERMVWLATVGTLALLAFIARQFLAARGRLLDLRAFHTDGFAFAFVVSFVAGAALLGSSYLIPSFAVSVLAFTPTDAGMLLLPGGAVFAGTLLLAAFLMQARKMPPIATVPPGILLLMTAMWMLSASSSQSGADAMMPALLLRSLGLGLMFLSITLVAFGNLPGQALASGIAMFNVGRQLGGLMGVAALQTLLDHQTAGNRAVLAAYVNAGAPAVMERIATTTAMLSGRGMDATAASKTATLLLDRAVAGQATVIAFNTAFLAVALLFVFAAPVLIATKIGIARSGAARRMRLAAAGMSSCVLLGGCVAGPAYEPPVTTVNDAWIASVDFAQVDSHWWRKLNDPMLNDLVDAAIANNKDLVESAARLREVRANRDTVLGRQQPQLGMSASATEQRISSNGQLPVKKLPALDPQVAILDAGFDASWEIDLWGGIRRAAESANARVEAAGEARRGVMLQVIAEVVRTYIDLRSAQSLRASAMEDAEAQFHIAAIVAERLRVGTVSRFDLTRAQSQARTTAATIPGFEADAAAAAFRLAVLVGEQPEARHAQLAAPMPLPVANMDVSAGLRAELLRRRPDVRLAERALAAATADVGIATAELFPRLSLIGMIGMQARSPLDLVASDSLRFQVGPSFRWPIFSAGRIKAQIRAADARADAAASGYERAVLNALADSETAINRFAAAGQTAIERDAARDDASAAVELARVRYISGEDDLAALLQAQSAHSGTQRLSLQARAEQLRQLGALYKALGGGWEDAE